MRSKSVFIVIIVLVWLAIMIPLWNIVVDKYYSDSIHLLSVAIMIAASYGGYKLIFKK